MTYFKVKCLIFLKANSFFLVLSLFLSLLLITLTTACQSNPLPISQEQDRSNSLDFQDFDQEIHTNTMLDQSIKDQKIMDLTMLMDLSMPNEEIDQIFYDQSIIDQQIIDQQILDDQSTHHEIDAFVAHPIAQYAHTKEMQQSARNGQDLDLDGLDDGWENLFQDSRLQSNLRDSDQDGIIDGDEDYDSDGLVVREEADLAFADAQANLFESLAPHPFAKDLLIELDHMVGRSINAQVYALLFDIWQSPPFDEIGGIRLHIYEDETIMPLLIDNASGIRNQLFSSHPPTHFPINFPTHQLIHIIVATKRIDDLSRGGEVILAENAIESTGLMLYYDLLDEIHPRCGIDTPPPVPFITFDEALAGTFAHELGHVLQLGHDTELNGENPWNLMAVTSGCTSSRQRFHGEGNDDPLLGSTQNLQRSRFSQQAFERMRFTEKLSVETGTLVNQALGIEH